jgi:tryptophan-rich hypothetical protein
MRLTISTKPSKKSFEINAKWSSLVNEQGWVHYRICSRRNSESGLEIEMMAVCDRSVRFWLPRAALMDPLVWKTGWIDV